MPPKKKGGKKGKKGKKGKGSGKKGSRPVSAAEEKPLDQATKDYYLTQIRDLESRIIKYQKKCDMLELLNKGIMEKFGHMGTEKQDIVSFLKRSLEQRVDEIADLNDRITGLQQAKDAEKESYEGQLQQLRNELQETKDLLTSENLVLSGKLASLEEFRVQREELMAKFAALEAQLAAQDQAQKETVYQLERKQVIDKDRLKKEVVVRVNQVAAEFRKLSNKQMAETTKRTIRENVGLTAQLSKMSEKTVEIIQENDEMKGRDKLQRQQLDMMEDTQHILARKNASCQQLIKMLIDKCKQQEAVIGELERQQAELGLVRDQQSSELSVLESTRLDLKRRTEENQTLQEDVSQLRGEVASYEDRIHQCQRLQAHLQGVLADSVIVIRNMLKSVEPAVAPDAGLLKPLAEPEPKTAGAGARGPTAAFGEESELEAGRTRDRMLERLLVILNSATLLGVGADFRDLSNSPRRAGSAGGGVLVRRSTEVGEFPGVRAAVALRNARGGLLVPPPEEAPGEHYRLGDMGLVPRAERRLPTTFEKMRDLSRTTRYKLGELGLN